MFNDRSLLVSLTTVYIALAFATHSPPPPSSSSTSASFSMSSITSPSSSVSASPQDYVDGSDVDSSDGTEHVCPGVDIRNQLSNFRHLNDCTVVEGFLRIILIEHTEDSEFRRLSFPKLREITGYLLLYRVYGLRSLSWMFPNLAVVRGQILFFNYALVVFEMPDIEDVGLPSLTRVARGGVRIEKNPHLCYIDTVDWTKVSTVKMEDNIILMNKEVDECVNVCPKDVNGSAVCPTVDVTLADGEKHKQELCWNAENCQKVCPASSNCGARSCFGADGTGAGRPRQVRCCHAQCLGGCSGPLDSDCFICASLKHDGRCVTTCPPGLYEYMQRRCITESECRRTGQFQPKGTRLRYWKLFNGRCVDECPTGHVESRDDRHLCEKCQGHCPKICEGMVVDSVAAIQKLKGCTIINGVLEIQLSGGTSVGEELEENLGMIEEIRDHLKVVRSYALVSLRFLKNLRLIRAEKVQTSRYAMFFLDNQNLQDLWDFDTHPNMTIMNNGTLFFHFNRKLCLNKIKRLVDFVGRHDHVDYKSDISLTSNGDQVACEIETLDLVLLSVESTYAVIRWTNFVTSDPRELLSWVVSYRKVKEENVTIYSSRDACGTDVWRTVDVRTDVDLDAKHMASIIYQLEPFTRYALYVQTYSISTARIGGMSHIMYFSTKPEMPSPARDITVEAKYPGELHVSWKEPLAPRGNVTHYYVYWQSQSLDAEKFSQRNYCIDKLRPQLPKSKERIEPSKQNQTNYEQPCCACPKTKQQMHVEDSERKFQIEFENFLHNVLYRKWTPFSEIIRKKRSTVFSRSHSKRKKRYSLNESDIENFVKKNPDSYRNLLSSNNSSINEHLNATPGTTTPSSADGLSETQEAAIVFGKTEIILTNLKHFQEYSIEVIACHDYMEGMDSKLCSNRAIISGRTLPNGSTDAIDQKNVTVSNETTDDSRQTSNIVFAWEEPESPNGLIVVFELELQKIDVPNYKADIYCIPHKEYRHMAGKYVLENMKSGLWTFKVRATSLAGIGPWTEPIQFFVADIDNGIVPINVPVLIGAVVATSVCLLFVFFIVVYFLRKKYMDRLSEENLDRITMNPNYMMPEREYIADEWEVPREQIKITRELGQGSFGMVYEGIAYGIAEDDPEMRVAIKTVNESANGRDRYSFLNEASVMKAFNSFHVVRLLGVVSQSQPVLVVMELMSNGDLKSFLRVRRPDEQSEGSCLEPPTLGDLLKWAGEIADGMAYLSKSKFVHRDLAARNCMVSADLVVKIGDFGMTRDVYETDYYRKGTKGLLPVRWMAPESLKDGIFTISSDVWSYGVVVWEMATLAAQPYQGLSNEQVLHYVIDGSVMDRPEGCPDKLYHLMNRCWRMSPKERPTFYDIIEDLSPDLPKSFQHNSFYYNRGNDREPNRDDDDGDDDDGDDLANDDEDVVDDLDDMEVIHSKTPLHPVKSSDQQKQTSTNDNSSKLMYSSRGFLMPFRLQGSSEHLSPSSSSVSHPYHHQHHRRSSGSSSSSTLNNKTSLCDVGLKDDPRSSSSHVSPVSLSSRVTQQQRNPSSGRGNKRLTETTNNALSSGNHNDELFDVGSGRQDFVRCGPTIGSSDVAGSKSSDGSEPSLRKNGLLVNGITPPRTGCMTSAPC